MKKDAAKVFGVIVAALALIGLFIEGRHFLGLMNVDFALDMARVILAAALLYVGFAQNPTTSAGRVLAVFGVIYIALAFVGMVDSDVGGILPTGLNAFDNGFHLITGALAVGFGLAHDRVMERHHVTR